ncbi:ABC-F family ATP-binding cassette domain-containing protein [Afifella marina]|uniref:ATPase components of ABC transporters with duplicated ATPase domains n=1 Tax=Afifella marina DSM 2698 TaxID=1120955 RepID=A0A1G5NRI1_AFIMA|nr:ABC-F family ATP-binding cassette domain-containing protein [Afifella marina]MBK1624804.1 ABC transporter [Afifella marina DSM 2698]MBK1628616.1 ABC transporter [Afifella marina]MBK5915975.1 ABC transporter [Afifella marina]RAI20495.1 ABC transporter [Afifella marina DSM 2698]SCZ39987.1 ATPase components of ABC transporters with duplicated ATPase domains [Afifella marina DSM 2698]
MSVFLTLSDLSWSTPDSAPLFSGLHLRFGRERIGIVGRNGIGKTTLLRLIAGELRPTSGHVDVHGTIGLMHQEMAVGGGETIADFFGEGAAVDLVDRAEAGLAGVDELARADWTVAERIRAALSRCGLDADPRTPLAALSGGERTRVALAALVFEAPDFLLLDEPTNNLDRAGRQAVIELIRGWGSGALIVSHDRELLEEMDAIVELSQLGAVRYGGNYSAFREQKAAESEAAERAFADAEKTLAETRRRAQQAAERKARTDSRGRKSRARKDQPKILMDAAKERAEATGGAHARLRDARLQTAKNTLAEARASVEILRPLSMELAPTGLPRGKTVLRVDAVTGGYAPERPVIRDFSLTITGPERVAIAGPNGCGKTTLIKLITGRLEPFSGHIDLCVPFAFLDQHVSLLRPELSLRENFRRLNSEADENQCRAALARFRFRAEDALQEAGSLSGGERLRAGLACTIGQAEPPGLLVLDEPTNHLDFDALQALENALQAYDGALLVVSHDGAFLARLGLDRVVELSGG